MSVRVKICGLARRDDAVHADAVGAAYLGVVLSTGFSRSVDPASASALVQGTQAKKVAVLVDERPAAAATLARAIGASVIQLHGEESVGEVETLRTLGEWTIWKAVRARSLADVARVVDAFAATVDGILVEGWKEGAVGGGGATLVLSPPDVRAAIPSDLDFVLAGGLSGDNVAEAVALFRPDVVDVSSGIEAGPRRKDPDLVRAFIDEATIASRVHDHTDTEKRREG